MFLPQSLYIQDVLGRFKTHIPGPGTTIDWAENPMDHRIRVHKNGATHMRIKPKEKDIEEGMEKCGAEVMGSLLWLANGTRPDISFAANQVAKYCCDSHVAYWNACKRILRYLSESADFGIHYSSVSLLPTTYFGMRVNEY